MSGRPAPLPPSRGPSEDHRKTSDEAIKFVLWAIGIGAGSTMSILFYVHATFMTKDAAAATLKATDVEIVNLKSAVTEIKTDNKNFQNWLRDNWHKRKPGAVE